jgi:hypothetical protein
MAGNLYIKYDASDNGGRPIPAGAAFWVTPSIWLTDAAGTSLAEAQVGHVNVIHAQVSSLSADPRSGARVQMWVSDYTAGFIGPDSGRQSSGGTLGRLGGVAGSVTSTVPGVATVDWTPVDADLINGPDPLHGHLCVAANVFADGVPPEGARLFGGRLDVPKNQHHAQRNITLVKTQGITRAIPFRVRNPGPEPAEFVLAGVELEGDAAMGPLEQEQLLMDRCVDLVGGAPAPDLVPAKCQTEPRERTWLAEGGQLVLRGLPDLVPLRPAKERAKFLIHTEETADQRVALVIRPGEEVPVVLTVEGTQAIGEVHAIDVFQEDTADGLVVGGGRVVVVETPDWFC